MLTSPCDIFPPFNNPKLLYHPLYILSTPLVCERFGFFCCFLSAASYTRDSLQFSYGCSTSLIIAEGAVRRQNRDISRVAECGEDNGVKREKSRLPTLTKQPPVRLSVTDICSGDQAGICSY